MRDKRTIKNAIVAHMSTLKQNLAVQFSTQSNPLAIDGLEFIEYHTTEPLSLGAVLERMGFFATSRHRSREVMRYTQGSGNTAMNIIVNADLTARPATSGAWQSTVLSAIALRVKDASAAYQRALELGAWSIPTRAGAMELNIPGIHGVGQSIIYFVDRFKANNDFSIYDVDFKAIPVDAEKKRMSQNSDLHFFGVVQTIGDNRSADWAAFYERLMGFSILPRGQAFGILPKGTLMQSPCNQFYLQLIERPEGAEDVHWDESLLRLGLGCADVPATVARLQAAGMTFSDRGAVQPSDKGAITQTVLGGVTFELVQSVRV